MKIIYILLFITNYFIKYFIIKIIWIFFPSKMLRFLEKVDNIFNVLIKVNRNKKKYLNHLTLILQENTITFLF
jgi:DNA integrity scanning protein DisA with diadenylate cyclase activity